MQVSPSKAEFEVRIEVKRRGLHKKWPLWNMGTVVIFDHYKGKPFLRIAARERVTKKSLVDAYGDRLPFTIPDLLFMTKNSDVPVYLDGPPHERGGVRARDERINKLWAERGRISLRFSYTPPLSQERKKEIVDTIEKELLKMTECRRDRSGP